MQVHRLSLGQVSAYLVETPQGIILIDAGMPHREKTVIQKLHRIGRFDLRLIYITHAHPDHYGSAAALKKLTGAPVAIHTLDSDAMMRGETQLGEARGQGKLIQWLFPLISVLVRPTPLKPDILFEGGERLDEFGLAGQILHTPGHTDGSSSLWLEEGILFAGDLVSSTGKPHIQRAFAQNWSLIPESLQRLRDLKPRWIYPGHGARPLSQREFLELGVNRRNKGG